jgi:23S rRNA (cytidine1920-2'-O)/16S rRNA (cytidine1409-2'-O)-methyltransferase
MTQRISRSRTPAKIRVDQLLVARGLAPSRAKAQAFVLAGRVQSRGRPVSKAGELLDPATELTLSAGERFVSRGGYKLDGALEHWKLAVEGFVCVDVGASTGGFTDCLLQRGAARVYAVDVGRGQLAEQLRMDPRVAVMDRTNARDLGADAFGERIDLVVVDASFIGIAKLLPAIASWLPEGGRLIALIKPQFEAGRREAARGKGVIRDPTVRKRAIEGARLAVHEAGFESIASVDSALAGPKGNLEHFVLARRTLNV